MPCRRMQTEGCFYSEKEEGKEEQMMHRPLMFDALVGKRVKIMFKGGWSAIGILEHRQWNAWV